MNVSAAGPLSKSNLVETARTRPFLLRNITVFLDHQEIILQEGNKRVLKAVEDRLRAHLDRKSWTMPTPTDISEAMKKHEQTLRINLKGIQRSQSRNSRTPRSQNNQTEEEDSGRYGTRKKSKLIDVPCTAEVIIWAGPSQNSMFRERRACRLLGHKDGDTDIHFDTELVEGPFSIHESNLEHLVEQSGKHAYGIPGKFHISIRLHFKNVDDSKEAISWMDSRPAPIGNGDWTLLEARWDRLPKCPADGDPLLLRRTDEVKLHNATREKDVGWRDTQSYLLIDMGWRNENVISPLARCNQIRRRARLDPLPTPPVSEPISSQSAPKKGVRLEWIFKDRRIETAAFRCGVCRKRNFTALDRLRLHILTTHTNNHEVYHIENEESQNIKIKVGFEQKIVGKNSVETSLDPPKPGSKEEHIWIMPNEKFNLNSYVRGNKRWTDKGYRISRRRKGPQVPTEPVINPAMIENRDLGDIESIPEVSKKRYKVPDLRAPNGRKLQVYTTKSRALVDPGDMLSESDDDPETEYVDSKREAIFQTMPAWITEKQKTFMRAWDAHILKEGINADRFLADSVYRWVKTEATEELLRDPEIQVEFEKKLEELREDELIDKTVFQYCLERSKTLATEKIVRESDTEIDTPSTVTSSQPAAELRKPRKSGKCICGETVTNPRLRVLCSNPTCIYPEHHIGCVGITDKKECRGWLCKDCREKKSEDKVPSVSSPTPAQPSSLARPSAPISISAVGAIPVPNSPSPSAAEASTSPDTSTASQSLNHCSNTNESRPDPKELSSNSTNRDHPNTQSSSEDKTNPQHLQFPASSEQSPKKPRFQPGDQVISKVTASFPRDPYRGVDVLDVKKGDVITLVKPTLVDESYENWLGRIGEREVDVKSNWISSPINRTEFPTRPSHLSTRNDPKPSSPSKRERVIYVLSDEEEPAKKKARTSVSLNATSASASASRSVPASPSSARKKTKEKSGSARMSSPAGKKKV